MSLHQCFSTMRLQPVGDIPGLRKVRPWILLPWILKTRTCWKQRAPLHRTESSLHWLWRLLLVWLSRLFPPLIPFSVMLDISFFKRQFMKSSLIPRMSITDIWRAKLPAAKCQVSHVQGKKKKENFCVILSCREPKIEKRTCDATTDPLCPHEQRQHWSARRGPSATCRRPT